MVYPRSASVVANMAYSPDRKSTHSRLGQIARRNYMKEKDIDESDDEESFSGSGKYQIDPSMDMWRPVDFGRNTSTNHMPSQANVLSNASNVKDEKISLKSKDDRIATKPVDIPAPPKKIPPPIDTQAPQNTASCDLSEIEKLLNHTPMSPPPVDTKSSAADAALAQMRKEKEEMKRMMEALQKEKLELLRITAEEKSKQEEKKITEVKLALSERDDLRRMLEQMRQQNEMLMQHMQNTEQQAQEQIENERKQRVIELRKMESMNKLLTQQVLDAQREAEAKLQQERQELKGALKRMEEEKLDLSRRIMLTEQKAKEDAERIDRQRREYEEMIQNMEREKNALNELLKSNELQSKTASEAMASQLADERDQMKRQLEAMDREKSAVFKNLKSAEEEAQEKAEALAAQLQQEKMQLNDRLKIMEQEKVDMAKHLAVVEKEAKDKAATVAEQLEQEKRELKESMERMEREKQELAAKLALNEENSATAVATLSEETLREREKLRLQMEQMEKEKAELAAKLKEAAEAAAQREKEMSERLARERDELREAVERMKQEMELEKQRLAASSTPKNEELAPSKSKLNLKPTRSLYDVVEQQNNETLSQKADANVSHDMGTIEEGDEKIGTHASMDTALETTDGQAEEYTEEQETVPPASDEEEDEFSELPAPHAAAARGNLNRIIEIGAMEPTLLYSYDSGSRCPLFYAVAYDKYHVAKYLVEMFPDCVHYIDAHGDTPLHAAASAGSSECMSLLLQYCDENSVNPVNSMGMTPVHLCQSMDCLELLHASGADLLLSDGNGRSALFIAAAMNRTDCVQYLIDCLDMNEEYLCAQDVRGDTPLHAAACNGSTDSLLLLLQCGISPLMTNKKGLKAIDLAQRNKKTKCRELLAQYHLHFATRSDFDSVLFLATLEVLHMSHILKHLDIV